MVKDEVASQAIEFADRQQQRAVSALPKDLIEAEDRIMERLARAKGGPFIRLRVLYDLMDRLGSALTPFTPCKSGCSSCCHYPVRVSELEVRYIERKTRHTSRLRKGVAQHWHGTPCPLLKDGRCSIYEHRPYVCRRHLVLTATNHWCHPVRANTIQLPLLGFSEADKAHVALGVESNLSDAADIRDWFPPPRS